MIASGAVAPARRFPIRAARRIRCSAGHRGGQGIPNRHYAPSATRHARKPRLLWPAHRQIGQVPGRWPSGPRGRKDPSRTRGEARPAYPGQVNPLLPQRSFAAYGASHWIVLILFAVGILVLAVLGGRYRGTRTVGTVGRVLAVVLVAFHVPILIYDL